MLLLLRGLFMAAMVALWVWSVIDVIRADGERVQYLHKLVWFALVLLLFPIGAIAWVVVGRADPMGARLFPQERPTALPPPDDSPEFLRRVDDEIRRRRRAEQMRRPDPAPPVGDDDVDDEIRRLEEEFRRESDEDGSAS